ncbi:hypothetical protein CEW46_32555, partial [Bacillus cereus]
MKINKDKIDSLLSHIGFTKTIHSLPVAGTKGLLIKDQWYLDNEVQDYRISIWTYSDNSQPPYAS